MDQLAAYCLRWARIPFEWGKSDCARFVAGWAVEGLGAAPCRLPVVPEHRRQGLGADVERMAALADRWAARAGLTRLDRGAIGSIGLLPGQDGHGFGISTGKVWAVRSPNGFALIEADPVAVWGRG